MVFDVVNNNLFGLILEFLFMFFVVFFFGNFGLFGCFFDGVCLFVFLGFLVLFLVLGSKCLLVGVIVGIILGGIVILVFFVCFFVCLCRLNKGLLDVVVFDKGEGFCERFWYFFF